MQRHESNRAESEVDAAMTRVLAAEREARVAIEAARVQAGQRAEAARRGARALEERRRERVALVHARMQQRVQAELDALADAARRLPAHDEPDAAARARVEAAVQVLARALTTPDGASP